MNNCKPTFPLEIYLFFNRTFHFQLSLGMPPIGPRMVHSNVFQRGLLDDEYVLLSVFLEAILGIFAVFVELDILKEPSERISVPQAFSVSMFYFKSAF